MAEHLSYLKSKSHSYVYEFENKRIARADENFAREVMQLFSSECADSTETLFSTVYYTDPVLQCLLQPDHSWTYRTE